VQKTPILLKKGFVLIKNSYIFAIAFESDVENRLQLIHFQSV